MAFKHFSPNFVIIIDPQAAFRTDRSRVARFSFPQLFHLFLQTFLEVQGVWENAPGRMARVKIKVFIKVSNVPSTNDVAHHHFY